MTIKEKKSFSTAEIKHEVCHRLRAQNSLPKVSCEAIYEFIQDLRGFILEVILYVSLRDVNARDSLLL